MYMEFLIWNSICETECIAWCILLIFNYSANIRIQHIFGNKYESFQNYQIRLNHDYLIISDFPKSISTHMFDEQVPFICTF